MAYLGAVESRAGEQAGPWEGGTATASGQEPDPLADTCAAAGPEQTPLPGEQGQPRRQSKCWGHYKWLYFPCLPPSWDLSLLDCPALLYHSLAPFLWLAHSISRQYPSPGTTPVDTPFSFSPSHPPTGCQFLHSHLSLFPFAGDWQLPTI